MSGSRSSPPVLPIDFDGAGPSVRLRILRDLWDAEPPEPLLEEVLAQREVTRLARTQRRDGTWASWLHRSGVSTENAVTRLAELGCPADRPPLSRTVPRLLALLEGESAPFVDSRRPGPETLVPTRLRRVAAGLLCQAGLADRKTVREAVEREVDRAFAWAEQARRTGLPVETWRAPTGRREIVYLPNALDRDGLPVPDLYWLRAVAFSPGLRGDPRVREVLRLIAGPEYQRLARFGLGLLRARGQRVRPGFGIRRSEPEHALRERRLGELLVVAELSARAGDPFPARGLVRFLDARSDARRRVRLPAGAFQRGGGYAIQRGWARLSSPWNASTREVDLSFRRALLARLSAASGASRA